MTDKTNHLRVLLQAGKPSLATRIWSTWPIVIEAVGSTGNYDYVEFVGEYTPFSQSDLENMARAAELHGMSLMMKVDFQNRGYVAQKAIASGVQAILFTDCRNAQEVEESIRLVTPEMHRTAGGSDIQTAASSVSSLICRRWSMPSDSVILYVRL